MKHFAAALLVASAQAALPHLNHGPYGVAGHTNRYLRNIAPIVYPAPGKTIRVEESISDYLSASDSDISSIKSEIASRLDGKHLPGILGRRQQKAIAERVLIKELSDTDIASLLSEQSDYLSHLSEVLSDSPVNRIKNHPGVGGNHLNTLNDGKALRQGRRDIIGLSDLVSSALSDLESSYSDGVSLSSNEYLLPGGPLGNLIAGRRLLGKGKAVIDLRPNPLVS